MAHIRCRGRSHVRPKHLPGSLRQPATADGETCLACPFDVDADRPAGALAACPQTGGGWLSGEAGDASSRREIPPAIAAFFGVLFD